ncbi:MAG TPA: hypothetical protein PLT82_02495 [Candidatus Hydrogenedens sp.]|nr:hypothetical protein [Candidatus Hydrogenedens sp.]HOL20677.1 hypothetical protein [Candidatus Hydrogenedens sp.]HPP57981.1 hypothetical protein [Candidatus Hydrogenedens sp.]
MILSHCIWLYRLLREGRYRSVEIENKQLGMRWRQMEIISGVVGEVSETVAQKRCRCLG